MATIRFTTKIDDVLTNVTSVVLSDPTGSYGIQDTDGSTIVAVNTALTNVSAGTYEYDFSDAESSTEYRFYIKWAYGGETHYVETVYTASAGAAPSEGRTMPSEVLWKYLVDTAELFTSPADGATWPLFIGHLPDANDVEDEAGAIYNTVGLFDGKDMRENIDQHFGIQISVRSLTEQAGYDKMSDIEADLKSVHNELVSFIAGETWQINTISQTGPIVSLGVDEQRRFLFTLNVIVSMVLT